MEELLLTILRQGSIAFLGSKITRALGQNEISELIEAGGWSIVSISAVDNVILPAVNWIKDVAAVINSITDKLDVFRIR